MTVLETSIEVVVEPPPTDSPQPHHLLVVAPSDADTKAAKADVLCTTKLSMEQDQESSATAAALLTTSSATINPRLTLKRIATSVSLDPLPTFKEYNDSSDDDHSSPQSNTRATHQQLFLSVPCSTNTSPRRREVSFDVSYSPHVVPRSRSDSRMSSSRVDVSDDSAATTSVSTTEDEGVNEEDLTKRPTWVPDQEAPECHQCAKGFTFFLRRRHHCRACGGVFCGACSSNRITIPRLEYTSTEVRVCDHCWVREAELRYRKPSVSSSVHDSLVFAPSSSSSARRRRSRRPSLSKSSEVRINKHLLQRSMRNMQLAAAAAVAKVKGERESSTPKEPEQHTAEESLQDVDAGHERKANQ